MNWPILLNVIRGSNNRKKKKLHDAGTRTLMSREYIALWIAAMLLCKACLHFSFAVKMPINIERSGYTEH